MKNLKILITLFSVLIFSSCEKTDVVEVDIEGKESIVVEGEVKTGEMFSGVRITKTLPVGIEYDIGKAEIKDAYAYIQINGTKLVPLHYTSEGKYTTLYNDLLVTAGDTYELFIKLNGKAIYSKTIAPLKPTVLSVNYRNEGYFEVRVAPRSDEVYGAAWVILQSEKCNNFFSIDEPTSNSTQSVLTRTEKIPSKYLSETYEDKRRVQVYAFDKQYSSYFHTKAQGNPEDNSVLLGGSGVSWNIIGENVIGLFIGIAESAVYGDQ